MKRCFCVAAAIMLAALISIGGALAEAQKEEVIYAVLDSSGQTRGIYVVNILSPDTSGAFSDFGAYEQGSLCTMNAEGIIVQDGDHVQITAQTERLFYEGALPSAELPWLIETRYTLDGESITPEALAGASGHMTITLDVKQNPLGNETLYQSLSLQITMIFSGDCAANVTAQGATQANVGADKQLVFMLLPGMGGTLSAEADIQNFEMDAITANALPMRFSLGLDADALDEQIDQLIDGLILLEANSSTLASGASRISGIAANLHTLVQSVSLAPVSDTASQSETRLTALNEEAAELEARLAALEEGDERTHVQALLDARRSDIALIEALASENTALRSAMQDMTNKLPTIKLQATLLSTLTSQISEGTATYTNGVATMTHALGIPAAQGETPMPRALADRFLPLLSGNTALPSFVSEQNGTVRFVQFVIKLDGIALPQEEPQKEAEEPEPGFLDRIMQLFIPASQRE